MLTSCTNTFTRLPSWHQSKSSVSSWQGNSLTTTVAVAKLVELVAPYDRFSCNIFHSKCAVTQTPQRRREDDVHTVLSKVTNGGTPRGFVVSVENGSATVVTLPRTASSCGTRTGNSVCVTNYNISRFTYNHTSHIYSLSTTVPHCQQKPPFWYKFSGQLQVRVQHTRPHATMFIPFLTLICMVATCQAASYPSSDGIITNGQHE